MFVVGHAAAGEPLCAYVAPAHNEIGQPTAEADLITQARSARYTYGVGVGANGSTNGRNRGGGGGGGGGEDEGLPEAAIDEDAAAEQGGRRGSLVAQAKGAKEAAEARKKAKGQTYVAGAGGLLGSKRVLKEVRTTHASRTRRLPSTSNHPPSTIYHLPILQPSNSPPTNPPGRLARGRSLPDLCGTESRWDRGRQRQDLDVRGTGRGRACDCKR